MALCLVRWGEPQRVFGNLENTCGGGTRIGNLNSCKISINILIICIGTTISTTKTKNHTQ